MPQTYQKFLIPALIALSSFAMSGYIAYTANDKGTSNRLTAVETKQQSDAARQDRIENKLDWIINYLASGRADKTRTR